MSASDGARSDDFVALRGKHVDMFLGNPPNQNGMRKLTALPFVLIALSANCITTEVVPVASTEAPVRAEMVVKKVQRHLCTTAWGGACSFQESAILLHTGPLTTREFGYGCTMTDGVVPGRPGAHKHRRRNSHGLSLRKEPELERCVCRRREPDRFLTARNTILLESFAGTPFPPSRIQRRELWAANAALRLQIWRRK
jgi:hypothetical protein